MAFVILRNVIKPFLDPDDPTFAKGRNVPEYIGRNVHDPNRPFRPIAYTLHRQECPESDLQYYSSLKIYGFGRALKTEFLTILFQKCECVTFFLCLQSVKNDSNKQATKTISKTNIKKNI